MTIPALLDNLAGAARIGGVLFTPFLRDRRARWGATDAEVHRPLPGDELVPRPRWSSTRAISIAAASEAVWPWIAQIGQGRGGLYSYEILENLAGCQIRNADAILAEYQGVRPGDEIRLHPKAPPIPVHEVVPGERLLLHGAAVRAGQDPSVSWLFLLEPADPGTRLMVRYRIDYPPGLGMHLGFGPWLVGAIHYVMERRMLLGIRERVAVEQRAAERLHYVHFVEGVVSMIEGSGGEAHAEGHPVGRQGVASRDRNHGIACGNCEAVCPADPGLSHAHPAGADDIDQELETPPGPNADLFTFPTRATMRQSQSSNESER